MARRPLVVFLLAAAAGCALAPAVCAITSTSTSGRGAAAAASSDGSSNIGEAEDQVRVGQAEEGDGEAGGGGERGRQDGATSGEGGKRGVARTRHPQLRPKELTLVLGPGSRAAVKRETGAEVVEVTPSPTFCPPRHRHAP
jgi:hypothetical protein